LVYEDMEPPPGADLGLPPYEGGAAAVRGGLELLELLELPELDSNQHDVFQRHAASH
jgi:hypothetical protein